MMHCCRLCRMHTPSAVVLLKRQIVGLPKVVWGERKPDLVNCSTERSLSRGFSWRRLCHIQQSKPVHQQSQLVREGFGESVDSTIRSWGVSNAPWGRNVWKMCSSSQPSGCASFMCPFHSAAQAQWADVSQVGAVSDGAAASLSGSVHFWSTWATYLSWRIWGGPL